MNIVSNEKRNLTILLPKIVRTGPILGAVAIANTLVDEFSINIVSIKGGFGGNIEINENIVLKDLSKHGGWIKRVKSFKAMMKEYKDGDVVFSMCFSADLFNIFFVKNHRRISSIRANNYQNYTHTYGLVFGYLLDKLHRIIFKGFEAVIVISKAMQKEVLSEEKDISTILIENFIDEKSIEKYRKSSSDHSEINFVFVGSLITRKQPLLLIDGLKKIHQKGISAKLHIVGTGPMMPKLRSLVNELSLQESVTLYGHIDNPYRIISKGDIFLMPSLSEGISRASLEALFLGLPCLLRDIDGNAELINKSNGVLFRDDNEFENSLLEVIDLYKSKSGERASLIPQLFTQLNAKRKLFKLFS